MIRPQAATIDESAVPAGATEFRAGARFTIGAIAVLLFAGLFLQRFGIPFGDLKLHVATVIALLTVLLGIVMRRVVINVGAMIAFLGFAILALIGALVTIWIAPEPRITKSVTSLISFVCMYVPFVLRARWPVPQEQVAGVMVRLLTVIAACGIGQFVAQFVGLPLFTFRGLFPDTMLAEEGYNLVIPLSYGGTIFKSNGLFLLEPSIFSQFMAVGIALEIVYFRRLPILALFGTGLLVSVSGTGIMVLAMFFLALVIQGGSARLMQIGMLVLMVCVLIGVLDVLVPEVSETLIGRTTEVQVEGSSAHSRFITPFLAMAEILERHTSFLVIGLGPGTAERLDLGFSYNINTFWKVLIEYGPGATLFWLALVSRGAPAAHGWPVWLGFLVLFFVTGGYQQLGPLVYLLYALFLFNRPEPKAQDTT